MHFILKSTLIIAALTAGSAQAALVNVQLTAIADLAEGSVNPGDTFSVAFQFDTDVPPSLRFNWDDRQDGGDSFGEIRSFSNSFQTLTAQVGDIKITAPGNAIWTYAENRSYFGIVSASYGLGHVDFTGDGYQLIEIRNERTSFGNINDFIGSLLSGNNVNLSAGLLDFNLHAISYASGTVNSMTILQTPIPSAAWLFGSALIGIAVLQRRKARIIYTSATYLL